MEQTRPRGLRWEFEGHSRERVGEGGREPVEAPFRTRSSHSVTPICLCLVRRKLIYGWVTSESRIFRVSCVLCTSWCGTGGNKESLTSSASPGSGCRSELGSGTANCAFAGAGVVLPSCPGEAGGPPSRVHSPPRPRATGPRPGQAGPRPPREPPPPPPALWALPMTSARSEAVQAESLLLSDPPACISAITGFTTSGK